MIGLILLGLIVGILSSGSGLGGGFLVVPALLVMGKDAKSAVGTSFIFILLVAVSSLAAHFRLGNLDVKTGLLLAAGGMAGAQAGPVLLSYIPEHLFKWAFGAFLIGTGVWIAVHARA